MSDSNKLRASAGATATARCAALFIAAPASGQGKTTVTAALARLHVRLGRTVRVFKCGPDFLDPQIHAVASAAPVTTWISACAARRILPGACTPPRKRRI